MAAEVSGICVIDRIDGDGRRWAGSGVISVMGIFWLDTSCGERDIYREVRDIYREVRDISREHRGGPAPPKAGARGSVERLARSWQPSRTSGRLFE